MNAGENKGMTNAERIDLTTIERSTGIPGPKYKPKLRAMTP